MKKQNKLSAGFTLIELVIVMFIIAIVAAISLGSLTNAQAGQLFNNNFEMLVSFLNNARTDAITAKGQPDYVGGDTSKFVTPANYGINFDINSNTIKLFSDTTPPISSTTRSKLQFDSGTDYANGDDPVLKNYTFPNTYQLEVYAINSSITTPVAADTNNASIFYSPLYADIYAENIPIDQSNNPSATGSFPFILIKLSEKNLPNRCRQVLIHQISGVLNISPCS